MSKKTRTCVSIKHQFRQPSRGVRVAGYFYFIIPVANFRREYFSFAVFLKKTLLHNSSLVSFQIQVVILSLLSYSNKIDFQFLLSRSNNTYKRKLTFLS
jgi:hypothetical protein